MKLHQTLFFRQFTAVLAGLLLALGTFAFVAIPVLTAPASVVRHLHLTRGVGHCAASQCRPRPWSVGAVPPCAERCVESTSPRSGWSCSFARP